MQRVECQISYFYVVHFPHLRLIGHTIGLGKIGVGLTAGFPMASGASKRRSLQSQGIHYPALRRLLVLAAMLQIGLHERYPFHLMSRLQCQCCPQFSRNDVV